MADRLVGVECSAHISAKSKRNSDVIVCKRCSEWEAQLKEALDELASIRMINELLQKELFTHASPRSMWEINPVSNRNYVQPFESMPSRHSSEKSYSEVAATGGKWI